MQFPASVSKSRAARLWDWSANPAAASLRSVAVLQLRPAVSGRVMFDGEDLTAMRSDTLRRMRRRVQLIFQEPIASLNPRRRVGDIVAEPLVIAGYRDAGRRQALVEEVLNAVGLDPAVVSACRMNSPAGNASASASPARWF
jgi:ABC-type microcin C transport system duplicated ATPase subunit YejF